MRLSFPLGVLIVSWSCVDVIYSTPNIIFIMADDLGWNDVSWHDPHMVTPNIHKLAFEHGVILNHSYVNQLCSPTRSAFLTGHFPFHMGTQNGVFHACEPTGVPLTFTFFPEILQNLSYRTYMVGKWHVGYCNKSYIPYGRGFQDFYGYYMGQEDYYTHRVQNEAYEGLDFWKGETPDFSQNGIYSTEIFERKAEEVLRNHPKNESFFLYLAFQAVHRPLQVPEEYLSVCHQERTDRRTYCGMVYAMDMAIGRVVQTLKDQGFYQNSIIIFSTDNGGQTASGGNNYPLRGNKATLWEGGTRAVSFLHSASFPPLSQQRPQLFHIVDWFPTILSMAGKTTSIYGDGVNQWEIIQHNVSARRKLIVYKVYKKGSAIRLGDYKLIVGDPGKPDGWIPPNLPPPRVGSEETFGGGEEQLLLFNLRSKHCHPV